MHRINMTTNVDIVGIDRAHRKIEKLLKKALHRPDKDKNGEEDSEEDSDDDFIAINTNDEDEDADDSVSSDSGDDKWETSSDEGGMNTASKSEHPHGKKKAVVDTWRKIIRIQDAIKHAEEMRALTTEKDQAEARAGKVTERRRKQFNRKRGIRAVEDLDIHYLQREMLFQLECVLAEDTKAEIQKRKAEWRKAQGLPPSIPKELNRKDEGGREEVGEDEEEDDKEGRDFTAWEVECYGHMLDQGAINKHHVQASQIPGDPGGGATQLNESKSSGQLDDEAARNQEVFGAELSADAGQARASKRVSKSMLVTMGLDDLAAKKKGNAEDMAAAHAKLPSTLKEEEDDDDDDDDSDDDDDDDDSDDDSDDDEANYGSDTTESDE